MAASLDGRRDLEGAGVAMRKTALVVMASGLMLTACGGPGASDVTVPVSDETLERAEYTDSQVQVYQDALTYETLRLNTVQGMTGQWDTEVSDEQWEPHVMRAKAFCEDARTNGWSTAEDNYRGLVLDQTMNAMRAAEVDSVSEAEALEMLAPIADAQFLAIGAEGSLCPELAPSGFEGTVIARDSEPTPAGEVILGGDYFGEGCEGAGNALRKLLGLFQGIEDGSTDISTFEEDVTKIATGLQYASTSERNAPAAQQIEKGVLGIVGLLTAFVSGDAEEFTDQVFAVSEQAVTIFDACELG